MRQSLFVKKILAFVILTGMLLSVPAYAKPSALTDEQSNAIAMLNYITVLTQDVNASKNSRLYMEGAYSSLINNTYPNAVDSRTLSQLIGVLDTMERYRMAALQREVRREPALALDGGADGLTFYRRIASEAALYLSEGGVILLEVGQGQAKDVCVLLKPSMGGLRVHRDLNGIERVVEGVKGT